MIISCYSRFLYPLVGCCLMLLLASCGSGGSNTITTPTTTGNTPTGIATVKPGMTPPSSGGTTAPVPPTQTSCPAAGTGRVAIMPAWVPGSPQHIVYIVNEYQGNTPTFGTLKRYDITTGAKTEIEKIAGISISDAQVSSDGQWILFVTETTKQVKLQLVRTDGQALQTLYCATPASNGANPASALSNIEWSTNQQFVAFTSYTGAASYLYLLNMQSGALQIELSTNSGVIDTPLTWLDNTRLYLNGPEVDAPPQALYLLDTSRGANQNPINLQKVFDASNVTGTTNFCWNADSAFDGAKLFTSQCTTGSGLTRLTSSGAGVSGGSSLLCPYTQYPWSNVSRDGSMFALQHNSANGQTQSLLFGSINGGSSTTFASISDGTQLSIVGWTTM